MKKLFLSVLVAGFLSSLLPASASVIHVVYNVKVTGNSIDGAGIFGTVGGNLSGQNAILDFSFNTATATWLLPANDPQWLTNDPSAQVTATINGHSITILGTLGGTDRYTSCNATFCNNTGQEVFGSSGSIQATTNGPAPISILTPAVLTADYLRGKGMWGTMFYGNSNGFTDLGFGSLIRDYPTDETVTISVTSGVPESSTWAMMVLGFAGVGYMTYRRRKVAALA
jgi:hypothetical protein